MFTCPSCGKESKKLIATQKQIYCINCFNYSFRDKSSSTMAHVQSDNPHCKMTKVEEEHLRARRPGPGGIVQYPDRYKTKYHN